MGGRGAKSWLGGKVIAVKSAIEAGIFKRALKFRSDAIAEQYHLKNNYSDDFWNRILTNDERKAVEEYTGNGYREMNKYLRGTTTNATQATLDNIKKATSALEKHSTKDDVVLYRGTDPGGVAAWFKTSEAELNTSAFWNKWIDKEIKDLGFGSTSIDLKSAWIGVKYRIFAPAGTHGMYADKVSMYAGEHEFLVQRDTTYKVLRAYLDKQTGELLGIDFEIVRQDKH